MKYAFPWKRYKKGLTMYRFDKDRNLVASVTRFDGAIIPYHCYWEHKAYDTSSERSIGSIKGTEAEAMEAADQEAVEFGWFLLDEKLANLL
jgi:hypothetical protein